MASITFAKLASELWRLFTTDGNPATAPWKPVKTDIQVWGKKVEDSLTGVRDVAPYLLSAYGGTANAMTATATPTLDSWTAGRRFTGVAASTNTTASPTINVDTLGAKTLADADGNGLAIGQHVAGRRYEYLFDGSVVRVLNLGQSELFKYLAADDTGGTNVNTAQPWFPTVGGITLPGSKTYFFKGVLYLSRSAGTNSHTISLLFGGTATITSIDYLAEAMTGDANTLIAESAVFGTAATALVVKSASTSATEQAVFRVEGILRTNASGTLIPQFQYSAAPGGAPTVKRGSHFRLTPTPDNAVAAVGPWA